MSAIVPQLSFDLPTIEQNSITCWGCSLTLPPDHYYFTQGRLARRLCRACWRKSKRVNYDPERTHWRYIWRKYKVSRDWYKETLEAQGGGCAICGKPNEYNHYGKQCALAVDHCHATGKVRGILCTRCNTAIERIEEHGEEWLESASAYLKSRK